MYAGPHLVEVLGLVGKVACDGGMHRLGRGIVHPCVEVRFDVNALQSVCHGRVKLAGGSVVLGRVARADDDPACREAMRPEALVLKKLQHGRHKRL